MAKRQDLTVDQGSTFELEIEVYDAEENLDETSYSTSMVMRKHYTSSNSFTFTTSYDNGILTASMPAANTANIPAGRYVYDIEITSGDVVRRILEGVITVTPEVSR